MLTEYYKFVRISEKDLILNLPLIIHWNCLCAVRCITATYNAAECNKVNSTDSDSSGFISSADYVYKER